MAQYDQSGVLTSDLAQFVTSNLSIHLAACLQHQSPTLVRALGCRVNESRTTISVLFPRSQGEPVIDAIGQNGRIAAVFNEPETHRTLQFKGRDARVDRVLEVDYQNLAHYLKAFSQRLKVFDVPEAFIYALGHCDRSDLACISFTPLNAFLQTPGSQAGQVLG